MTTYILNPNSLAHRYLRRIYNVSAGMTIFLALAFCLITCTGTPFSGEVRIASSVTDLLIHDIPNICVKPLVNASKQLDYFFARI
jgi:hypothetical protein